MLSWIFGGMLLAGTAFLFLKYRPRKKDSRLLCLLCAGMGVLSFFLSGGVWWLQLVEYSMQAVAFACCLLELHREKVFRTRRMQKKRKPPANPGPVGTVPAKDNILYPPNFAA